MTYGGFDNFLMSVLYQHQSEKATATAVTLYLFSSVPAVLRVC